MNITLQSLNKSLEDLTRVYNDFSQEKQILETRMNEIKLELQNKVNEANNYITSQLTAASQWIDEKIETKVSTAMAGEEAFFLEKVDTKILTSSNNLKKDVLKRFIDYFENGYIQWPGMPSPLEDTSLHFEGYSWYETNYDGNFFRAKGRNANPFSSKRFTMEQIKNGTYAFEADEQGDAIRNIKGKVESFYNSVYIDAWLDNDLFHPILGDNHYGDLGGQNGRGFTFDISRAVPTAEENRSRNLTFITWALVKDE